MRVSCAWNEGLRFTASTGEHAVAMDAKRPIGAGSAMTPKELVLAGLCGCTAMDVASLMRKYRQNMTGFEISAEASIDEKAHPAVFQRIALVFSVTGEVDPAKLVEAVTLSQTKYCAVSAMLVKAVPISYDVYLNGALTHSGSARFA